MDDFTLRAMELAGMVPYEVEVPDVEADLVERFHRSLTYKITVASMTGHIGGDDVDVIITMSTGDIITVQVQQGYTELLINGADYSMFINEVEPFINLENDVRAAYKMYLNGKEIAI